MSKLTLLIDGNWLLMSRSYSFIDKFSVDADDDTKRRAQAMLLDGMLQSINFIVNKFPVIDNMILVSDGGSWRKQIERPACIEGKDYKGTRTRDESTDWNMIFETLNILRDKFEFNQVTTAHSFGIEGDDWIGCLSRRLAKEGSSTLIWSTDNDLSQLVSNERDTLCAWYNGNELKLHKSLNEQDDIEMLLSFDASYKNEIMNRLVESCNKVTYIDPNDVIISKIICGDKSDNIIPVAQYVSTKTYSITDKQFQPIKEELELTCSQDVLDNDSRIAYMITHLQTSKNNCKYSGCDENDIIDLIHYNRSMVELKDELLPIELKSVIDALEVKEYDISNFRNNYMVIIGADDEINSLVDSLSEELPF